MYLKSLSIKRNRTLFKMSFYSVMEVWEGMMKKLQIMLSNLCFWNVLCRANPRSVELNFNFLRIWQIILRSRFLNWKERVKSKCLSYHISLKNLADICEGIWRLAPFSASRNFLLDDEVAAEAMMKHQCILFTDFSSINCNRRWRRSLPISTSMYLELDI